MPPEPTPAPPMHWVTKRYDNPEVYNPATGEGGPGWKPGLEGIKPTEPPNGTIYIPDAAGEWVLPGPNHTFVKPVLAPELRPVFVPGAPLNISTDPLKELRAKGVAVEAKEDARAAQVAQEYGGVNSEYA